jgi:hypothetical protein
MFSSKFSRKKKRKKIKTTIIDDNLRWCVMTHDKTFMTHESWIEFVHQFWFWISETYQKWKDMHYNEIVGVEHESVIRFHYPTVIWKSTQITPEKFEGKLQTFRRLFSHPNKITWLNNSKIRFGICLILILISSKIRSRDLFDKYHYVQKFWRNLSTICVLEPKRYFLVWRSSDRFWTLV